MRLVIVVGVLVLAAGAAPGAYVVELNGGERMQVDSYWEEGDRMHLMSGGVDMSVPRSRVRSLREVSGGDAASGTEARQARPAASPAPAPASAPEDLERRQRTIEKHLLRVQQQRFEAAARGEPARTLNRLGKEFRRTQQRRLDVERALEHTDEHADPQS